MTLQLPLTREEILALDGLIQDGLASRMVDLSGPERLSLSVWNGMIRSLVNPPARVMPRKGDTPLDRWFLKEGNH